MVRGGRWLNLGGRGHRRREANLREGWRARKVDPADVHRFSGMIPRANKYHLPHRKADIAYTLRFSCRNSIYRAFSRVCSSRRSEKWIFWDAWSLFFFGKSVFPSGASAFVEPSNSTSATTISTHRYFHVSQNYKGIRLSRNPCTSRFTVPSWQIAQSNRECLLLTLAFRLHVSVRLAEY